MKRFTVGAAVLAIAAISLVPSSATAIPVPVVGGIPVCLQVVPSDVAVTNVAKTLNVRVLLDQVTLADGEEIVARAQTAYAPLGITLNATYEGVSFTTTDSVGMIAQAKAAVGGSAPPGIDLVYGLTSQDMAAGGSTAVAGQADCIGGISDDDRAFAVGEAFEDPIDLGLTFLTDFGAKVMAHELGHLLGAHHHYANCVEAAPFGLLALTGDICTLMFNDLTAQRLQFSTLNGLVVRGNAQQYAGI